MLDLSLKILKSDKTCPGAAQMIDWLKGVFDALDKKYVSCFFLVHHDQNFQDKVYNWVLEHMDI
jgi:hypothetical protein